MHGYDAPWSIGAIVLGWLYGEGISADPSASPPTAARIPTAARTLSAILIIGREKIPGWSRGCSGPDHLHASPGRALNVPKTIDEALRASSADAVFLERRCVMMKTVRTKFSPPRSSPTPEDVRRLHSGGFAEVFACGHDTVRRSSASIRADQRRRSRGEGRPDQKTENHRAEPALYAAVSHRRLHGVPEDWDVPGDGRSLGLEHWHGGYNDNVFELEMTPAGSRGKYDCAGTLGQRESG
ncbi:MAG: hypothetical protein ACLRSW_05445 [Christensenellaceae bacterium]